MKSKFLRAAFLAVSIAMGGSAEAAEDYSDYLSNYFSYADAWEQIRNDAYPPLGGGICGEEIRRVLRQVSRITSDSSSWSDKVLLQPLRDQKCIGEHFWIYPVSYQDDWDAETCKHQPGQLEFDKGIWVMSLHDFFSEEGEGPACKVRENQFWALTMDVLRLVVPTNGAGRKPFILDLRDNPGSGPLIFGGLLGWLFSPRPDILIYTIKDRNGSSPASSTMRGAVGCPEALLVNKETASGAEIMAATIRSWCPTTTTFGQRTYGKGCGSEKARLGKFIVQFCAAEYLAGPSYTMVERFGVIPDVETPLGAELEAAEKYIEEHPAAAN